MAENIVNNGRLIDVELPNFVGKAGYQDGLEGNDLLSYRPNRSGQKLRAGETIQLEGKERTIARADRSEYIRDMVTLQLVPLP
jgi:hypothetical protein